MPNPETKEELQYPERSCPDIREPSPISDASTIIEESSLPRLDTFDVEAALREGDVLPYSLPVDDSATPQAEDIKEEPKEDIVDQLKRQLSIELKKGEGEIGEAAPPEPKLIGEGAGDSPLIDIES